MLAFLGRIHLERNPLSPGKTTGCKFVQISARSRLRNAGILGSYSSRVQSPLTRKENRVKIWAIRGGRVRRAPPVSPSPGPKGKIKEKCEFRGKNSVPSRGWFTPPPQKRGTTGAILQKNFRCLLTKKKSKLEIAKIDCKKMT